MNLRDKTYQMRLNTLRRAITRKGRTAEELAELLGVSKPTVYAQLAALQEKGALLVLASKRGGARGPAATVFRVARQAQP